MPAIGDALSLTFDVPVPVTKEAGHGEDLTTGNAGWTFSSVVSDSRLRGYFLDSAQHATDWRTTTTGDYLRQRLADFAYTPGTWEEVQWNAAGDYWCSLLGTSGTLTTSGTGWSDVYGAGYLRKNPHIHVSAWLAGVHDTNAEVLRLVWGNGKWRLRIYGNGSCSLDRDEGSGLATVKTGQLFSKGSITHGPVSFRIVPLFRRCLMLWGHGNEVCYEDYDVDPATADLTAPDADNPLVEAGTLALTAYARMAVQVTEVKYLATGTAICTAVLPYEPTGAIAYTSEGGDSLHRTDTPNGSSLAVVGVRTGKSVAVTATMTRSTDKLNTPVLYAAGFQYDPTTETKVAANDNMLAYTLQGATLQMDEEGSSLTLPLKAAASWRQKMNRHVLLKMGTDEIFRGHSTAPTVPDVEGGDALELATFECMDEWKRLDKLLLPQTYAFDGMLLTDAVKAVLKYAGYTSANWDIDTTTFRLPTKGANQTGDTEAAVHPSRGQSVGDFLRYLRDTYTNWFMDFSPVSGTVKFRFKDPDLVSATPVLTLYKTRAKALLAGKDQRYVVRDWSSRYQEPEGTEVWCVGTAPGGKELWAAYIDYEAEDPTLAEVDRKTNWVGEIWQILLIDPGLTTQDAVDRACRLAGDRWCYSYEQSSLTADWHPELVRHGVLRITESDGSTADYVVTGITVTLGSETSVSGCQGHTMEVSIERKVPR